MATVIHPDVPSLPPSQPSRHSRRLTLRAAVALIGRLDGGDEAHNVKDGLNGVSKRSICSIIKALVQKVMDLRTANDALRARAADATSQVQLLTTQVQAALAQATATYERLDALQAQYSQLQGDVLALHVDAAPAVAASGSSVAEALSAPAQALAQQQGRLVSHVHTMAKQLTATSEQLKSERSARRAVSTAYKDLLASHMRMMSTRAPVPPPRDAGSDPIDTSITLDDADGALAGAVATISALASDDVAPSPRDSVASETHDETTADETTAAATAVVGSGRPPLHPQVQAAAAPLKTAGSASSLTSGGAATSRRRSWLLDEPLHVPAWLPGIPAIPISNQLMQDLSSPQLTALVASLREHSAALQSTRTAPVPEEAPPVTGLEATLLQRFVDTVDVSCAFGHMCMASQHAVKDVGSESALGRSLRRLRRILQPLPPSSIAVATGSDSGGDGEDVDAEQKRVPAAEAVVMLATRVIALYTAMSRLPPPRAASASPTAAFLSDMQRMVDDVTRSMLPIITDALHLLVTAARRAGVSAALHARSATNTVTEPPVSAVDGGSSGVDAAIGDKTKLEWFADMLFNSVATATWQPHAGPTSSPLDGTCSRCGTAFGLFNRRHHCRACGDVVCNTCSTRTLALADLKVPLATIDDSASGGADLEAAITAPVLRRHSSVVAVEMALRTPAAHVRGFDECIGKGQQRVCDACYHMLCAHTEIVQV